MKAFSIRLAVPALLTAAFLGAQEDAAPAEPDWDEVLAQAVDSPRFAIRRAATGKLARAGAEAIPAILRFEKDRGRNELPLELVDALARSDARSAELMTLLRSWADDREFYWRAQALGGLARRGDAPSDGSRFLTAAEDPSHLMRIEAVHGRLRIAPGFRLPESEQPQIPPTMHNSLADWNLDFARRTLEAEDDPRARLRMALLLYAAGDGSQLGEVFVAADRVDAMWLDDPWGAREAVFAVRELRRLGAEDFSAALSKDLEERIQGRAALAAFVIQAGGVVAEDEQPADSPAWSGGLEIRSCRNGDLYLRWTDDGRLGLGLAPGPADLLRVPTEALRSWRNQRPAEMAGSAVHGRLICDFVRILDPASNEPDGEADEDRVTPGIHRKCAPGATPEPLADWLKTLAPVLEENDVEPLADRLRARLPQFVSTGQGGN